MLARYTFYCSNDPICQVLHKSRHSQDCSNWTVCDGSGGGMYNDSSVDFQVTDVIFISTSSRNHSHSFRRTELRQRWIESHGSLRMTSMSSLWSTCSLRSMRRKHGGLRLWQRAGQMLKSNPLKRPNLNLLPVVEQWHMMPVAHRLRRQSNGLHIINFVLCSRLIIIYYYNNCII
jgi:hypothetical protein